MTSPAESVLLSISCNPETDFVASSSMTSETPNQEKKERKEEEGKGKKRKERKRLSQAASRYHQL
jgi:hypothetical protein